MSNDKRSCKNHKKQLFGIGDMRAVADAIGDLHYETLAELMKHLHLKVWKDAQKDLEAGRTKLGNALLDASFCIDQTHDFINTAWEVSKPFMESKNKTHER